MAFIKNTILTIFSYFLFFQSLLLQFIFWKKNETLAFQHVTVD